MPFKSNISEDDAAFRKFERSWKGIQSRKVSSRGAEPKGKFLTEELIRNRKAETKNGRQELVLLYAKGIDGKIGYTLDELNIMAKKMAAFEDKMGMSTRGVKVGDLLKVSHPDDKRRSKDIRAATLYKVQGNTLSFQVTSSGETPKAPSHYSVRVRLEDWGSALRKGEGLNYFPSAQQATNGHISYDCTCGRHQYWYRYLATIGGFALVPEHVFPKIRNRKLKGACCKHTLKVIATILSPVTQTKLAKEMERQAKTTNFETGRGKFIEATEAQKLQKASEKATVQKAYREYKAAQAAFEVAAQTPAAKAALKRLQERNDAKMQLEIKKREALEYAFKQERSSRVQLEKDVLKSKLATAFNMAKRSNMPTEDVIKYFAEDEKISVDEAAQLAKDGGMA